MKGIYVFTSILSIILISSCNHVSNRNKIFAQFDPSSAIYKRELAKQIINSQPGDLTYTFDQLLLINGKNYLSVKVTGKDIVANGVVLVNNWNKLEELRKTKGLGYSGAELRNLTLDIYDRDTDPILEYKDVDKVVD